VHVALGGLMDDPDTAAQDPIFWLHHANIDRMWNRWLAQGGGRTDATDAAWLDTQFTFFDEAGHAVFLTGAEIVDTVGQLNYRYDDDPLMLRRRFPRPVLAAEETRRAEATAPEAPGGAPLQVLAQNATGAAANRIELAGKTERVQVPLTEAVSNRMRALVANNAPGQVFLRLDDIRYDKSNGVYYEVYVNPPPGEKLDIHTPGYAGNLALFGLKPHAMPGHPPPPARDIYVEYDISQLVRDALAANPKDLTVELVPRGLFGPNGEPLPVSQETQGSVGSVQIMSH